MSVPNYVNIIQVCIISERENKRILPSQNSVKNVQLGNSKSSLLL